MALKVSNPNDVKIYTIASSTSSALPDWLAKKRKKQLRGDQDWTHRVELIQDLEFPEASLRLKQTRDEQFIIASGVYKPQIRVFELSQMSMKFDRHYDCENVQMEILSDDWRKFILLQADRSVEFHTQNGLHFKTRIPKFGRDMAYHYPSCDLLLGASGNEVYRLNLEQGRFLNPLQTDHPGVNVVGIHPVHQLWCTGGEDGCVEFWDHRDRSRIGRTRPQIDSDIFPEITALSFIPNQGLTYGLGTKSGHVLLYDLRMTKPLVVKDHQYEMPIKKINFHPSGNVFSADSKIIKIWNKDSGKILTSIEPDNDVNDLLNFQNSGLFMTANEGPHMSIYFIPSLGPAPKWCSFLDNITEELEENPNQNIWDDYKFVTLKELKSLGLNHLIGTNLLKAYMHGYFIDLRLYEKAKMISNPFAYEEYKQKKIKEKIEKEQKSRISSQSQKLPKVNKTFAQQLLSKNKKENLLEDSRFKQMFEDAEFEVDQEHEEYQKFHTRPKDGKSGESLRNKFIEINSSASESESTDEESMYGDSDIEEQPQTQQEKTQSKKDNGKTKKEKLKILASKDGDSLSQILSQNKIKDQKKKISFMERLKKESHQHEELQDFSKSKRITNGAISLSFKPKQKKERFLVNSHSNTSSGGGYSNGKTGRRAFTKI